MDEIDTEINLLQGDCATLKWTALPSQCTIYFIAMDKLVTKTYQFKVVLF
jgi:hypothetical protein